MRSQTGFNRSLCIAVVVGMGLCSTAGADAPEKTPLEQVEAMVVLNETGIISITYEDPWFWEVGYYAVSLWSFMADALDTADAECANVSQALTDSPDQRLGAGARRALDSLLEDGRIKDSRLLSSLLKRYSRNNPIDPENASDRGRYQPLSGDICSNLDPNNPGYLQQMFPPPMDDTEAYYRKKCERIEKTAACLNDLNVIDKLNRSRQGDKAFREADFSANVFPVVAGSSAND